MSQAFLGEIRMFAGKFAPSGNAFCNGQSLPISQNSALYSLLGTTYGGDGINNFDLPNLQSRVPIHYGSGSGLSPYNLGQSGGEATHTLTSQEYAPHIHPLYGVSTATATVPNASVQLGAGTDYPGYLAAAPNATMSTSALSPVGSNQAHANTQPTLTINFIIALQGIFPSRN